MARVNLESVFFADPKCRRFASELGCSIFEARGILATVWFFSQESMVIAATVEQFEEWLFECGHSAEKIVEALSKSRFIEPLQNGAYRIRGNQKHVEKLSELRKVRAEAGRKGGKSKQTQAKPSKPKQIEANASKAKQNNFRQAQCISLHCNSLQSNSEREAETAAPPPTPPPTTCDNFQKPLKPIAPEPCGMIEELRSHSPPDELVEKFQKITHRVQKLWLKRHTHAAWIVKSLTEAHDRKEALGEVPPKGWSVYFSDWLAREKKYHPPDESDGESFRDYLKKQGGNRDGP